MKLWGLVGTKTMTRVVPALPDSELARKWKEKFEGKPLTCRVARVMTGPNVGTWIQIDNFSGDCLTNMKIDVDGALNACKEIEMLSNLEIIEVDVKIS